MPTPAPPPPPAPATPLRSAGAVLALVAAALQVLAGFHRWTPDGDVALDVALASSGRSLANVGTALLVLAAVPALAALVTARAWPRLLSAVATGGLVLWWVASGPVGSLGLGVQLAAAAVCLQLFAAALAD